MRRLKKYNKVKLTVVIVSYNVKYYLEQCLGSLRRSLQGVEAEVYVVDNHSKDGTVGYLSGLFPDLYVIASPHNLGFARANNLAIRKSDSEYVLLLNPDTIVGENTIRTALDFMDAHPDAGSLGVRMLDSQGVSAKESRRGVPTPMVAFYKMAGLCAHFPKSSRFGHYYMGDLPWDAPARVEVVSGAFCLLRREALNHVGLLDEDFFMYGEDIDLSYRILKGGYHNYYIPSLILHYKGESTQKSSFRYVHVFYEAMLIFFKKHYSGMSLLFSVPVKFAIYAKAAWALLRMQMDKARKSLGFITYKWVDPLYIFVGGHEMIEASKKLAQDKGLEAKFVTCGAENLCWQRIWEQAGTHDQDGRRLRYVVFDTSTFSYESAFSLFIDNPAMMTKMAFYHLESGKLITENEVLC